MSKKNMQLSEKKGPSGNSVNKLVIREPKKDETEKASALISRLKRLNGEFDPLLKTTDSLEKEALKTLETAVSNSDSVVLVALTGTKFVGVVKADIKDRTFYE